MSKGMKQKINCIIMVIFIFSNILVIPFKNTGLETYIYWTLITMILLSSLYINKNILNKKLVSIYFIFTIIFMLNMAVVNYKNVIFYKYLLFIKSGILAIYFAMNVKLYEYTIKVWYYISVISFFILNINLSYFNENNRYMNLGMYLTTCFIGYLLAFKNNYKYKIINIILLIICFLEILILGNRGSIIICSICSFYVLIKYIKSVSFIKKISISTIFLTIISYIILNIYNILNWLNTLIKKFGFYSYSLTNYLTSITSNQNFFEEQFDGRNSLFSNILNILKKNNFRPMGMGGLQVEYDINYPHNIMLEILVNFGLIIGILLIVIMVLFVYRGLRKARNNKYRDLIILILIYCVGRLTFSGTYWEEELFWILIGLIVFHRR